MKWKEADFNNNIGTIRALLIYGPDAGQVDEYCDRAIEKNGIERDNLFTLDANDLREKQDALFAEACSPSMFGGRKMVIIAGAGDSDAKPILELIECNSLDATVIVTGGDLRAGGGLRAAFEGGDKLAALACYTDDARTLAALIQRELFAAGITKISPDAMGYMTTHLGGDRGVTRSFLTKIALYVDDKKTVELDDVEKCLPDTGAANTDDFLYSLTAGHLTGTMTALDRLFYDGAESNMLLRMLDIHFKKLQTAVLLGQMPRLFYKVADKFNLAVRIWSESEITAVLLRLNELEKQMRTRGMVPEILLRDFALKLAAHAMKLSIRKRN
jgi:DNA polymerase-3 subunit delta